jgi:hypothetical protein
MWILAESDKRIAVLSHLGCHVGVQIQDPAKGYPRASGQTAEATKDFTFYIIDRIRQHSTVQDKDNTIQITVVP